MEKEHNLLVMDMTGIGNGLPAPAFELALGALRYVPLCWCIESSAQIRCRTPLPREYHDDDDEIRKKKFRGE